MLIEFRVENHRSLREEQALTLESSRLGDPSDTRPRQIAGHSAALVLPVAAIYGANASGKSNVLSALDFMRESVVYSQRHWEPDAGVPRIPFAWADNLDLPSTFEVIFVQHGTKYQYGFSASNERIEEEWLFAWPNNRKQVWLEREYDSYKFGDHLQGPNASTSEITRPNSLFLSAAAQNNHKQLLIIFSWFRNLLPINVGGKSNRAFSFRYPPRLFRSNSFQLSLFDGSDEEDAVLRLIDLLQAADTGVVNIKTIEEEMPPIGSRRPRPLRRIMLQHQKDNESSWLDLEDESEGTKTLFRIAPSLFQVLDTGSVLIVDELESSLHPLLALTILRLFNNPVTNPQNAQLIFTTHDTNLLGTTLGDPPLRRDQVWFTEKDNAGKSCLYPLTDFKPRQTENLERGYLQGRYGAIPFLGDIRWVRNGQTK